MPSEAQDLVLAGALISIMLNPLIFRLLDRWQARQDAGEQARQARDADAALAEDAATHQVPDEVTDHAIVVGYGRVGNQLAALLKARGVPVVVVEGDADRVATARESGRSEEHTSELQSLMRLTYAVYCLKKKNINT